MDELLSSLDNTLFGFWDWHINDDYEYLSPGFKQMLGYDDHEMENHPSSWQRCIHAADLAVMFSDFEQHVASKGQRPFQRAATFRHKDGHDLLILCSGQVVEWNADGSPARAMGTHVDLTTLSIQQQLAAQQEMFYQLLFDTTTDAVMLFEVIDRDRMDYRLIRYNPAALSFWGGEDKDMQSFDFSRHLLVDDLQQSVKAWRQELEKQGFFQTEIAVKNLKGTRKIAVVTVNRLELNDRNIIHVTYRDITKDRKRLAQMERALEKEKVLNNLRKSFVSTASHQFRTPLAVIQSNVDLVERYLPAETPEPLQQALARVTKEVEHMTTLMDDVVLLGQIEANKVEVDLQSLQPAAYIDMVCSHYFSEDQHRIRNAIDPLLRVRADPTYFEHVIINVLSNACKYSAPDTPIIISASQDNKQTRLTITDQGIGIAASDLPHLTNSFYRGENAQDYKGSGLGLNITLQLLQLMGGDLQIESTEGEGTTVTLALETQKNKDGSR